MKEKEKNRIVFKIIGYPEHAKDSQEMMKGLRGLGSNARNATPCTRSESQRLGLADANGPRLFVVFDSFPFPFSLKGQAELDGQ